MFFFFNDTATTEIYTLSLHDALPISGDLPHLTNFSQAYFVPRQRAAAHSHSDMFEVFLVESGSGVIRVDGEEHRLEKGTCVVVQPGEVHEIVNSGTGVLVLTYFGIEA